MLPTIINTPHIIPTPIGQINSQEAFQLYKQRVKSFEGTLQFDVRISAVEITRFETITHYSITAEGTLTNISNDPIVVHKKLSSGFTNNEDVSWKLSYGDMELPYFECCVDTFGIFFLSPDDYVILQPSEFQNYLLRFALPLEIPLKKGTDISLSGKKITLTAIYFGSQVGHHKGSLMDNPNYIDMNSWVGRVQSNSVEYVFP